MAQSQHLDLEVVRALSVRQKLDVMNGLWRQAVTLKAAWIKLHHPELGEAEVEAQAMKLVAGERS